MILREFYTQRPDGVNLYRTYSDTGMMVRQIESGAEYSEAIDVEYAAYTYEETDTPVEEGFELSEPVAPGAIPAQEIIHEWVQPDSINPPYMRGDRVVHNGSTWESQIDGNVWGPGALGTDALWIIVNEG